jgi:non-heme Fe2+,alpha-ketoglutarate-dependent halogenase
MGSQLDADAFASDGYAGPFTLVDPAVAARLVGRIREEVLPTQCEVYAHSRADRDAVLYLRDRHLDSPLLYRIATANEILSRLPPLLGPDILLWRSDMFEQAPGDVPTSPHQDGAFESARATHPMIEVGEGETPVGHQSVPVEVDVPLTVSAWITFTPVREQTGALWVVPGTHKEIIPEVPGNGFAGMKYVPSRHFEPSDGRVLEMEAGQFILFHNLLVHGSLPVQEGRRLAWTCRYVSTATRIHHRTVIGSHGQDLSKWGAVLVLGYDHARTNVMRAPPAIGSGTLLEERALAPRASDR